MLSIQRWSPDTCDCKLYQIYDDAIPGDSPRGATFAEAAAALAARIAAFPQSTNHTPLDPVVLCAAHLFVKPEEHHDVVLDENQRKNKAYAEVIAVPGVEPEDFAYSFDATRRLVVEVKSANLEPAAHAAMATELVSKFGADKVSVK